MELKDFVSNTITQISEGLIDAQKKTKDLNVIVNVPIENNNNGNLQITNRENARIPQILEFDLCVGVENSETADTKGKLNVLSSFISGKVSKETINTTNNRIKFSVPVLFPTDFKFYYEDMEYKEKAGRSMRMR